MIILPAIDIKDGKCVRLKQGLADQVTIYGEDPAKMAKHWQEQGAAYLHLVDLDGAFGGSQANFDVVDQIAKTVKIPFEIGGGIRDEETIQKYLRHGASRVILGTKAVEDLDFVADMCNKYGDTIAVSVDAKGEYVAVKGWVETSQKKTMDFCKELKSAGVHTIVYTDISRDGMLTGPNMEMLKILQEEIGDNIIASGGVSNISDIIRLKELDVYGAITGKALYEGTLTMEEIRKVM